jgi:hypothetical protein
MLMKVNLSRSLNVIEAPGLYELSTTFALMRDPSCIVTSIIGAHMFTTRRLASVLPAGGSAFVANIALISLHFFANLPVTSGRCRSFINIVRLSMAPAAV